MAAAAAAPALAALRRPAASVDGLALGLYLVVLSVSGSLSVLRPDVHRWFVPRSVPMEGTRLTGDALQEAVRRTYPLYEVTNVFERRRPDTPVMVTLQRDGATVERLFDPYAARDLGLTYPPITEAIEWVVDLHDNLLTGTTGRMVNGIGALSFLTLAITGAVVWWPGVNRLGHSLVPGKPANSARFARRLHNALGIWLLALHTHLGGDGRLLLVSGSLRVDDRLLRRGPDRRSATRRLARASAREPALRPIVWAWPSKWLGLPSGLVPAVLFITGGITWWVRVVRRRATAANADQAAEPAASLADKGLAEEGVRN